MQTYFKPMEKNNINKAIVYDGRCIDLIRNRKLKEIITTESFGKFLEQKIFICDREKIYGIVILNKPNILNVDFFKNHFSRHNITEEFRQNVWSDINRFYSYSFRIKKIFKEPLNYFYEDQEKLAMSKFIEDVELLQKGVIGYRDLGKAPIETSWDGSAERKKASVEVLKIISAWFDSSKPDIKSSYKLPHHKAEGQHSAVFRGVTAAMGALLGARGGTKIPSSDRRGVYNHLKKHYGQFDKKAPVFKSYEVDELKSMFPELYRDVIKYEERLEILKSFEVSEDKKHLKELFIQLYKLFLKRLSEKAQHTGRRPCPPGMVRDRQTGRCVRRSEQLDEDGVLKQIKVVIEGNFIRARLRNPSSIVKDSFRTITLSKSRGIKAIIGKLKSDPKGPTHVQAVLFEKNKWTIKRARAWVEKHKESLKSVSNKKKDKNLEIANV